jgi:hypothetical protein
MELDTIKEINEKTLIDYSGKDVIVRDAQRAGSLFRGTLGFDMKDSSVYHLINGDSSRRFYVCDLEELIIP